MNLSPVQWKEIAQIVGCDIAALKAVVAVESAGSGFLPAPDGRVLVRFENHYFWRLWGKEHAQVFENNAKRIAFGVPGSVAWAFTASKGSQHTGHLVSFPNENGLERFHGDAAKEWRVFDAAMQLDTSAAIQSASFGLPQVMGANYRLCGHNTPESFFMDMCESEYRQIRIMASFICGQRLDDELRRLDWKNFAFGYNGPSFYTNNYDQRLKAAYEKLKAS